MSGFIISDFHGVLPRRDDRLKGKVGIVAHDVDLGRGTLKPWRWDNSPVNAGHKIKDVVFREGCAPEPLKNWTPHTVGTPYCTDLGMHFWIEGGVVYQATDEEKCAGVKTILGILCPPVAPVGGEGSFGTTCATPVYYRYTYMNEYGQESAPSPPLVIPAGGVEPTRVTTYGSNNTLTNVYRAVGQYNTGDDGGTIAGEYTLVGTGPANSSIAVNGASGAVVGLISERWAPPKPGAIDVQFISRTNSLAILYENEVWISEPGQLHAFPGRHDLTLSDNGVCIRAQEEGLSILTDGHPYFLTPTITSQGAAYSITRHSSPIPCTSAMGAVVGSDGTYWPSDDGYFSMGHTQYGLTIVNITEPLFHLEDWRTQDLDSIRAAIHNGALYWTSDAPIKSLHFEHRAYTWRLELKDAVYEKTPNAFLTSLSVRADGWYRSRRGDLYYSAGTSLYRWNPDDGEKRDYLYISAVRVNGPHVNMGGAKVVMREGKDVKAILFSVLRGNWRVIYERMIGHSRPFVLPMGHSEVEYAVGFSGITEIEEMHVATSIFDLTDTNNRGIQYE